MLSEHHAPGEPLLPLHIGDVLLTRSEQWTGKLIRFGQRLRWRGTRRRFARYNHVALATNRWEITEARAHGVVTNPLTEYRDCEFLVVRMNLDARDKARVLTFAESVVRERWRYAYLELLSLAGTLLTPRFIQFGMPGTLVCSGFVAEALCRTWVVWDVDPTYAMPADIAEGLLS